MQQYWRFMGKTAIKLLRLIVPYLHHPIKWLRAELILVFYDGKINYDTLLNFIIKRNTETATMTQRDTTA
jgi:hypothetical protein